MKFLLGLAIVVSTNMVAIIGDIPAQVKKSFETKFQTAKNVKWVKENAHEYEATFIFNDTQCSANFSDKGEWLETEFLIKYDELPTEVKDAQKSIKNAKIIAVATIESANADIKYEIEYKQGRKTKEVFYNKIGKKL